MAISGIIQAATQGRNLLVPSRRTDSDHWCLFYAGFNWVEPCFMLGSTKQTARVWLLSCLDLNHIRSLDDHSVNQFIQMVVFEILEIKILFTLEELG